MLKNILARFNAFCSKLKNFFKSPEWFFTIPLIFALVMLGIRFLSMIFDTPKLKFLIWTLGAILVFIIWSRKDDVLAKWLNNFFVQLFMFLCLRVEDIIYTYKGLKGYWVTFSFVFAIVHSPAIFLYGCFGINPFVWYWFLLIMFGFYLKLRNLFIFPDMDRIEILKDPNYMPLIEHPDKFNWNLVINNANTVFFRLHGKPISNQLTSKVGTHPLRYAGIRYMSSWKAFFEAFGNVFSEYATANPKKAVFGAGVIASSGLGYGLYSINEDRKHREAQSQDAVLSEQRETIKILPLDTPERAEILAIHLKSMAAVAQKRLGVDTSSHDPDNLTGLLTGGVTRGSAPSVKDKTEPPKALSVYEESGFLTKVGFFFESFSF